MYAVLALNERRRYRKETMRKKKLKKSYHLHLILAVTLIRNEISYRNIEHIPLAIALKL